MLALWARGGRRVEGGGRGRGRRERAGDKCFLWRRVWTHERCGECGADKLRRSSLVSLNSAGGEGVAFRRAHRIFVPTKSLACRGHLRNVSAGGSAIAPLAESLHAVPNSVERALCASRLLTGCVTWV